MTIFALVTTQGTAASEAALCPTHVLDPAFQDEARVLGLSAGLAGLDFKDCSGNEELRCIACPENWTTEGDAV